MTEPTGHDIHGWIEDLFPLCRSLTGPGTRESLRYFQRLLPDLEMMEFASGEQVFDWTIPDEWTIRGASITTPDGQKVVDFDDNNLHVVGYSEPVQTRLSFKDLESHLYSLPHRPDAIPYITSYYARRWGFCMTDRQLSALRAKPEAEYDVVIDATLEPGTLQLGELVVPGETDREILFSSYLCHPSMANNELSGPAVMAAVARWVASLANRKYTYRFLFSIETVGTIAYLSRRLEHLQKTVDAGFVLSCIGDGRAASCVQSPGANTLADRVARHCLEQRFSDVTLYSFVDRGSDERQFCSPHVNLPVCTLCRSKFGAYPEYHTSDDNLELVQPDALQDSFELVRDCVLALEGNTTPRVTVTCEPQLGKRGLYPTMSTLDSRRLTRALTDMLAYCDGQRDLIEIATTIGQPVSELVPLIEKLVEAGVVETCDLH